MNTLELTLPTANTEDTLDIKYFIAAKLFEAGKLSIGQAADMSGLSKTSFAEIVGNYGVSIINYSAGEAVNDYAKL